MNVLLIARRELGAYLNGLWGWAIVAITLLIDGLLFYVMALEGTGTKFSHDVLHDFFYNISGTTMIVAPLLTMRTFAEERQTGTEVLLDTAPVSSTEIVLGKYVAALAVMTLLTLATAYMPALVFLNGKVAVAQIVVGYIGLIALASAASSIGIFGSSLVKSQVAAVILAGALIATMVLMWLLSTLTDPPFTDIVASLALHDRHFMPFCDGRLLTSNLVFYASVTYVFLMLATRTINGRRWQ